jgi:hypothetical protein
MGRDREMTGRDRARDRGAATGIGDPGIDIKVIRSGRADHVTE